MKFRHVLSLLFFSLLIVGCTLRLPTTPVADVEDLGGLIVIATIDALPTDTPTLTPTSAPPTSTPAPTSTPTSSPTLTETPTPAPTEEPVETLIKDRTATPTPTDTPTPTETPTPPPTDTPIPQAPSETATPAPTETPCSRDEGCIPTPAPTVAALVNTENILLLGTDRRKNDTSWRTDTVMLVSIDWDTPAIGVLSFPRDLLIEYPWGGDKRRINEVDFRGEHIVNYPDGGFGLMRDVFEQNFGIRIDHFVRLHRSGFVELVDAIGGVDVDVDCDLWELSPKPPGQEGYKVLYVPAGTHHFDGESALSYATYRYVTGDWDRRRRQQVVLLALREQAIRADLITQIPRFIDILGRNFQTDINLLDLARYAKLGIQIDMDNVHSKVLGRNETKKFDHPSGAYYLVSDGDKLFEAIRNVFVAAPIIEQAERPQGCPPPPSWAKDYYTPTPPPQGG